MKPVYGLLGEKLTHSLSPQIHKYLCGYDYSLFEMPEDEIECFLKESDFSAINVTIPYKKTVMPFLDRIDEFAKKIGSVNTIKRENDGTLSGYNTDYFGFSYLLARSNICVKGKKCIILGSGGSAVTVNAVLSDFGARSIFVISRSGEDNYDNISKHFDAEVIINTTPVGMYPKNIETPINLHKFTKCEAVVDIIYNPLKTKLLLDAEKMKIKYSNGLSMLVAQAKLAAEIFTETKIDDTEIERVLSQMERDALNIVLVGMPGCGKTTIAIELSKMLNRKIIDIDDLIVEKAEKTIPEIFKEDGEEVFRKIESECAFIAGQKLSQIIATGGGIIKRKENFDYLRQNAFVVFLERDLEKLSTEGRPLSKNIETLKNMYNERYSLYDEIKDVAVKIDKTPSEISKKIIELFYNEV